MATDRRMSVSKLLEIAPIDASGMKLAVGKIVKATPKSDWSLSLIAILFLLLAATLQHSFRWDISLIENDEIHLLSMCQSTVVPSSHAATSSKLILCFQKAYV